MEFIQKGPDIISFILGIMIGIIFSALLLTLPAASWANKAKLRDGRTIAMPEYFAQYSAVRRFPR